MKLLYLVLCVVGAILPGSQFALWVIENNFNLSLFIHEAFSNRISAFAWLDVLVSGVVVLVFVLVEGRQMGMRHSWAPLVALFTVGVSLALPLFLLLREIRLARQLYTTKDGVSINELSTTALAEKLSALATEDYLGERAKRGKRERFKAALAKVPDVAPQAPERPIRD